MELEHVLPHISRHTDGEKVLATCRRFAGVLTERTWHRDDVLHAHIQREVKRVVTVEEPVAPSGVISIERNVTVGVEFFAEKEQIAFDDEAQRPLFEETYKVSAQLREQVRPDELPDWVLASLKKRPLFTIPTDTVEEPDETDIREDTAAPEPELNLAALYSFDFEKVTEIEYVIDVDGDIEDYTVTCRYLYDTMHIDERSSGWGQDAIEYVGNVMDGEIVLSGIEAQSALSEEDVRIFEESFDSVMGEILNPRSDDENDDEDEAARAFQAEQDELLDSHYRRALGMIALNSQRFIGMRIK